MTQWKVEYKIVSNIAIDAPDENTAKSNARDRLEKKFPKIKAEIGSVSEINAGKSYETLSIGQWGKESIEDFYSELKARFPHSDWRPAKRSNRDGGGEPLHFFFHRKWLNDRVEIYLQIQSEESNGKFAKRVQIRIVHLGGDKHQNRNEIRNKVDRNH
ncbi:hypothetical protein CCY99_08775 [Helicobacter sp. 16-1353]|uniref:hypothetical protein n=1 Tax=Helicobacter sp. 16-1353 TaxID=2004996 RepID=UPI000DCC560E|nr:hypothetical protein [Helicobacter sp. 16-1353]RAX51643.1 hypothetical protein CCY99_08775 [Helicobacter sp. 16-1353]